MKRLLYAPKVYVFVRCSNLLGENGPEIRDVSPDVVSGSVSRNVNDVSTAEVILKNRFQKYVRDEKSGRTVFTPMDLITIWLQRIAGKPIQVFTGYLDSVPYYQMYPGNCAIRATCTLKKLKYTWFDPGLAFFKTWLEDHDWVYNAQTGQAINPFEMGNISNKKTITDGGFGQLLYDFMAGPNSIAQWDANGVIVSNLPADLPKRASKIYTTLQKDNAEAIESLSKLLGSMMGIKVDHQVETTASATTGVEAQTLKDIRANAQNVPDRALVFAALAGSNLDPSYNNTNGDDSAFGSGLYAMRPDGFIPRPLGGRPIDVGPTINGKPVNEILSAETATKTFASKMQSVLPKVAAAAGTSRNHRPLFTTKRFRASVEAGNQDLTVKWIEAALGYSIPESRVKFAADNIEGILNTGRGSNTSDSRVQAFDSIIHWADWNSDVFSKDSSLAILKTSDEFSAVKNYQESSNKNIAKIAYLAKKSYDIFDLVYDNNQPKNILVLKINKSKSMSKDKALKQVNDFADRLKGNSEITSFSSIDRFKIEHELAHGRNLSEGKEIGFNSHAASQFYDKIGKFASDPNEHVFVEVNDAATLDWIDATTGGSPEVQQTIGDANAANDPKGLTLDQLGQFSLNAAFAAQFSFPSNQLESQSLTGNKALMNDTNCYDAVTQFCQASMRNFMSLPDGSFCAFYPDYFGAYGRKPYWAIGDIEIINMGIQLNDDTMATHVYTIGDHYMMNGSGSQELFNEVHTSGVVTIIDEMVLDSFIVNEANESTILGRENHNLKSAMDILQHYGARVHKEEFPLIKNGYYEFLLALQKFQTLWASQFITSVEFTFQPEVMPGGLIAFPEHGLQMYCESVTHNWDYASGFTTEARLSAPSIMKSELKRVENKYPGFAIAGTMSVGA